MPGYGDQKAVTTSLPSAFLKANSYPSPRVGPVTQGQPRELEPTGQVIGLGSWN